MQQSPASGAEGGQFLAVSDERRERVGVWLVNAGCNSHIFNATQEWFFAL